MTEKAEIASDSASLPPTYTPSEAFTDSPPPVSEEKILLLWLFNS